MKRSIWRFGAAWCSVAASVVLMWNSSAIAAADPWADAVVSFSAVSDPAAAMVDFSAVLGPPTLVTDPTGLYGGVVTPLNPSFGAGETLSIGEGGWLTVRFDEPVTDDPGNPFGVDLLVFGNSFITGDFFNQDFTFKPDGLAAGVVSEGGVIELSSDGVAFFTAVGDADGAFPTNAYADVLHPFTPTPGNVPADFTKPVDPALDPAGKTFAEIIAGYEGAGGGVGIDIAAVGLSSVSYVRISNPAGSGVTPEIDAFADVTAVPEPAGLVTFLATSVLFTWQIRARR